MASSGGMKRRMQDEGKACLNEAKGVGRKNSEMAKRDEMAISGELVGEGKVVEVEDGRNGFLRS